MVRLPGRDRHRCAVHWPPRRTLAVRRPHGLSRTDPLLSRVEPPRSGEVSAILAATARRATRRQPAGTRLAGSLRHGARRDQRLFQPTTRETVAVLAQL